MKRIETLRLADTTTSLGLSRLPAENSNQAPRVPMGRDPHAWFEQITTPERVREVLSALARHRAQGVARKGDTQIAIRLAAFDEAVGALRWELDRAILPAPFEVQLQGYSAVFQFGVLDGFQRGQSLISSLPRFIARIRQRFHRRTKPGAKLAVEIQLPDGGETVTATVSDLSYGGIGVAVELPTGLEAGRRIDRVRVTTKNDQVFEFAAEVCFLRAQTAARPEKLGLRILHEQVSNSGWRRLVDDVLHAGTRTGFDVAPKAWELYERCGYFNLSGKNPDDFAALRESYLSVSRQLDRAPHIACQVSWPCPTDESIVATATIMKPYRHTWLGLHMAKDSGDADGVSGRRILRGLNYRCHEHIQLDPEAEWFFTCIQVKKVWTRYALHDYPKKLEEQGEACIVRFRALEVATDKPIVKKHDFQVASADYEERDAVAEHIAISRPAAYAEALDLTRERMSMEAIRRQWQGVRLERAREVLVAYKEGQLVAAAVLEMAAEGLHLFHLLDLVRLYPLVPGGEEAFGPLIAQAQEWFADFEKEKFVIYLENGVELSPALVEKLSDLGEADMCILAAHRLPELNEHIHEITAPKLAAPDPAGE